MLFVGRGFNHGARRAFSANQLVGYNEQEVSLRRLSFEPTKVGFVRFVGRGFNHGARRAFSANELVGYNEQEVSLRRLSFEPTKVGFVRFVARGFNHGAAPMHPPMNWRATENRKSPFGDWDRRFDHMPDTYTQLYLHVVWATWDRLPMLRGEIKRAAYACIQAECRKLGAGLIVIGGTEDHVHVLVELPATISVADFVKQIKGSSSHLVTHCVDGDAAFKWQKGYGAFTVSKSLGRTVRAYIQNQEAHHRDGTTHKDMELAWEERAPVPVGR